MRKKLIIFQDHFAPIGGVETNAYNMAYWLRDYYDLKVVYGQMSNNQFFKFSQICDIEKYDKDKEYVCDICIRNSLYWVIPENIKADRYIEILHADYEWLLPNIKNIGAREWDKAEKLGCGEYVAKQYKKVKKLDKDVPFIRNILAPKVNTSKVIHLISATRLGPEKGWNRMLKMADMMRKAGIKFEWNVFTNDSKSDAPEEFKFWKARNNMFDYVADADYTVLLSNAEGLPFTVQESLQYGTPVICTDIGGCTELVKDGVNGYVVPLDMNFDINKIKKIPKFEEYTGTPVETWLDFLGGAEYKKHKDKTKDMVCIKALKGYFDTQLGRKIYEREEYFVTKERAEKIINAKLAVEIQ